MFVVFKFLLYFYFILFHSFLQIQILFLYFLGLRFYSRSFLSFGFWDISIYLLNLSAQGVLILCQFGTSLPIFIQFESQRRNIDFGWALLCLDFRDLFFEIFFVRFLFLDQSIMLPFKLQSQEPILWIWIQKVTYSLFSYIFLDLNLPIHHMPHLSVMYRCVYVLSICIYGYWRIWLDLPLYVFGFWLKVWSLEIKVFILYVFIFPLVGQLLYSGVPLLRNCGTTVLMRVKCVLHIFLNFKNKNLKKNKI